MFEADGFNVLSGDIPLFATHHSRALEEEDGLLEGGGLFGGEGSFGGLQGIHISLRKGERMSVEGPSGLGKTRLLRAIAQLDPPLSGLCVWVCVCGFLCVGFYVCVCLCVCLVVCLFVCVFVCVCFFCWLSRSFVLPFSYNHSHTNHHPPPLPY